ncbi:hypothetical protein JJC03_09255 [Flavobacterium oreochromis]|uniref:hypothetical protein n=1 Tax=Flavobacterium oreochromis TaxID=2906078 RepID=UPI001CE62D34|nr:hypothetical protein [Flavobacterium oreochromis]QYS85425.1 hypothetical protein JJC03_09255 [Flavobacterium oreochromis]
MFSQLNKVNPRKEFFKLQLSDIKDELDRLGIQAKWTMTAEAIQYRESLAIEEAFTKDKQKQIEWENFQLKSEEAMQLVDEEV